MLLWSLRHHYLGLGGDARLYAVQALARIHPNLSGDLYLQNASQDSYTLFSSLYAPFIGLIGLGNAALTLTLAFKVMFFAACWLLARRLVDGPCAFLSVALLILIPGVYGAFGVFQYAEDWLTARSAAEALVVTAITCSLAGGRLLGNIDRVRSDAAAPVGRSTRVAMGGLPLVAVPRECPGSGRRATPGAGHCGDRMLGALGPPWFCRDRRRLAGDRTGTLAIPPAPVLARQGLEPERSALFITVLECSGNRRCASPESWRDRHPRRWRRIGCGAYCESGRSGKHSLARTSVAVGVGNQFRRACYSWCRRCGLCGVQTDAVRSASCWWFADGRSPPSAGRSAWRSR